jgi:integrase
MSGRSGSKNGHHKGEDLLKFQSMKDWLESLDYCAISRGQEGLTKQAKRQRLSNMAKFTQFSHMNPDELLTEAKENIDNTGKRLLDFFNTGIEDGKSRNTMATRLSFLRGFYSHNNLYFPKKWRIPSRTKSQVKSKDEQNHMFKLNGNGDTELKAELLQHFVGNLSFRDQVVALCLLSTGADAQDVLNLNFEFLKDATGEITKEKRLLFHGNRAKDGIEFRVFLSKEATEFLKRYAKQVQNEQELNKKLGKSFVEIDDDTPLFFVTDFARGNFGERLSAQSLSSNFRESAKKMGYTKNNQASPFRPKRFRHLFRNACSYAKIGEGWINSMMGHRTTISQSYIEQPVLDLQKLYTKLEPYVTVFSTGQDLEMTKEVNELKDDFTKYSRRTMKLEDEVKNLSKQLQRAIRYISTLTEEIDKRDRLEAQEDFHKLIEDINKEKPVSKKPTMEQRKKAEEMEKTLQKSE